MRVPTHIAAWALQRIQSDPAARVEFQVCMRRLEKIMQRPDAERILKADLVSDIIGLSALISSLTGGALAVAGTAGAVIGGASIVGGALIGVALSIGINYAASKLLKASTGSGPLDDTSSGPIDNQAIQVVERQAIPSKRIIYGTALVSGALFFEDVKPPHLFQGLLLCAKPVTDFRQISIGTEQIGFTALTPGMVLTPIAITGQPNYPGRLQVSLRLGAASQAIDPLLAANYASLDASFRQQGIATAVLRYDYGADFTEYTALWGQVQRPNPLFLIDGVAVPDPRNPAHTLIYDPDDPVATAAAEATWSWSNNAALIQAHYLTQRYGGRVKPSKIDWVKVATAADWDDGLVACTDGTLIKRHTIDGVVTLDQSPSDVMSGMISANRGFILQSAGKVWVSSSVPRTPIATIHDGLLTGPLEYRAAKPKADLINRVKVKFVAPDREYQEVDGPVLARADLRAADGELLDGTLDLPFTMDVNNVDRVQRLQKAFMENSRLGRQVSVTCDVVLLADCEDDLVGNSLVFDSVLFAQANGIYQVTQWGFSDNFSSITLSLTEYDPSIETDFVAAVDEQPFTLAPLNLS